MNPSYRVLIAEDEATYAMTVARFLQERGHEIKVCPTGKAAFKALADSEWDVLLLDLKLPDADGVEILSRVRQEHESLQTIIVTGFANVDSRSWRRKGGKLANVDLWQALDAAVQPHSITWHWVRGHAGDRYNQRVDRLAKNAIPQR